MKIKKANLILVKMLGTTQAIFSGSIFTFFTTSNSCGKTVILLTHEFKLSLQNTSPN